MKLQFVNIKYKLKWKNNKKQGSKILKVQIIKAKTMGSSVLKVTDTVLKAETI